jgi:hypothetical protein
VHTHAITALAHAVGPRRLVQISAVGVAPGAETDFLTTKAAGDAAIRSHAPDRVILRPGLVMAEAVYGSTGLLRTLAGVPLIQPIAYPDAPVQVIALEDVAEAVVMAVRGDLPHGLEADLVADTPVRLADLVAHVRRGLGFAPARVSIPAPGWLVGLIAPVADGLGWLGWRSPLRTTALTVVRDGVTGDPGPWRTATGKGFGGVTDVLARRPSTLQDRWHARLSVWMPVVIAGLALFWLLSGAIGLIQFSDARAVLTGAGVSTTLAGAAVIGGAVLDIALGLAVLVRTWARAACLGMIALSLGYLAAGTLVTPELWADPLGPFVKVIPAILLAGIAHALLEPR